MKKTKLRLKIQYNYLLIILLFILLIILMNSISSINGAFILYYVDVYFIIRNYIAILEKE